MQLYEHKKEMIMKASTIAKTLAIATVAALTLGIGSTTKAEDRGCSNATLKGTYSDKDTGYIVGVGQFAGVNLEIFDGNGGLKGSGVGSLNGQIVQQSYEGTYTVNADCTGTYKVQISPLGITTNAFFVIADGGIELQIIITDQGNVITCVARKQFRNDPREW